MWRNVMRKGYTFAAAFLATSVLSVLGPVSAAEVSADRLINADKEPQNWLMNHRTYDAQRYSPLDRINKDNVKNLKLAYSVALGGTSVNENLQATPLAGRDRDTARATLGQGLAVSAFPRYVPV